MSTSIFLFQMAVSIYLLLSLRIVIALPISPAIFYFLESMGLPPHRLYRDSLSLILNPGPTDFLCKEKVDDCLLEIPTE